MKEYKSNIERETLRNKNYRKVLFTATKMQLVVMSLKPKDDIPMEVHHNRDQFIRLESGQATVVVNDKKHNLKADDAIIIPAGSHHWVINTSKSKDLKLYTIYASPEHPKGTVQRTRNDALKAKH